MSDKYVCQDCGYRAPGPIVFKFHRDNVECILERRERNYRYRKGIGKNETVEQELQRLIKDQAKDARVNRIQALTQRSLDEPFYRLEDGTWYTLGDLLEDKGWMNGH